MATYSDYLAANGPTGLTGLDVSNWIRDAGLGGDSGVAANALVGGLLGAQSSDREAFGNRANEYLADMAKQFGHPVTEADLQNPAFYNDPKNQAIFNAMAERGNRYAGGSFWGDALGGALRVAAAAYGMNSAFPGVGDVGNAALADTGPFLDYGEFPSEVATTPPVTNGAPLSDFAQGLQNSLNASSVEDAGQLAADEFGNGDVLNQAQWDNASNLGGVGTYDAATGALSTDSVGSKIAAALKDMAGQKGTWAALSSLATSPTAGAVPKLGIPQTDSTSGIASGQGSSGQASNAQSGQASQAQQIAQQLATPVFPVIQDQKSFKVSDLYPSAMLNSQEPTSNQVMNMAGSTWNPQMLAAALRG